MPLPFVERRWSNACFGVRVALKSRVLTVVVVATLALGIAVTSAWLWILNALFIQPLPIHEATGSCAVLVSVAGMSESVLATLFGALLLATRR